MKRFFKIPFVVSIFFWIIFMLLLYGLSAPFISLVPPKSKQLAFGCIGTFAAFLTTYFFLKAEKKSYRDTGLFTDSRTLMRFLTGLLIGAGIFAMIIVILRQSAGLRFERNSAALNYTSLLMYAAILPLAFYEELAFRGYPFRKLEAKTGLFTTQIIVAPAFAVYHMILGWTPAQALMGPGIWAFVFGLGAARSGGIALPTGIHVAINGLQKLMGFNEQENAVWVVAKTGSGLPGMTEKASAAGLAAQILIFVAVIVLTFFYSRKPAV